MELLLEGTIKQIKEAASQGALTWKGRKAVLDPFLFLDLIVEVDARTFLLTPLIIVGSYEEKIENWEAFFPLGALQRGVFRFWKEAGLYSMIQKICALPPSLTAREVEALLQKEVPIRWKGEKPRLKPAPLPLLKLTDRTGGFANLTLDYGEWGQIDLHDHTPTEEEKYWETDLLETGFKKKILGTSHYFCPLDQVGKTLAFLLEVGWKVVDYRGKQLLRQQSMECRTEEKSDAILLRGTVTFGKMTASIQDVVGSFERRERWIDLSPHHVGLIELPPAWEQIAEEEKTSEGIRVRKMHLGLLEEIAPLPPSYQRAEWEDSVPSEVFQGTLFPYQQKGLSWLSFLSRAGFSGLLADEMGLGKTVQVLAFLSSQKGSALIIMPVTLLSLWKQQFKQFLPDASVYLHQGPKRAKTVEEIQKHLVVLTSYATVRSDIDLLTQTSFDMVILDEAQMIKNSSTQNARSVYRLKSRFRLALTGTPIENRPEEIISIFNFLMPALLQENSLIEMSYQKMRPFILRRTKQEVGLDLPEKMIQIIGIAPSEEEFALYEELLRTKRTPLLEKIASEGVSKHRMEVLELILRLRQHCCHPRLLNPSYAGESSKFTQVLMDLEEVIASNHKVLVYSQFTSMLKLFEEELQKRGWNYVTLDGSTRDRETPVLQFQNDPSVSIFLISLKAGGVGLNLQAADYVFLYDPWWNHAVEQQAIDRAHRVGRKNRVIARKYFITQSIEAKIFDLQTKKEAVAQSLWENHDAEERLSFEAIQSLLEV